MVGWTDFYMYLYVGACVSMHDPNVSVHMRFAKGHEQHIVIESNLNCEPCCHALRCADVYLNTLRSTNEASVEHLRATVAA